MTKFFALLLTAAFALTGAGALPVDADTPTQTPAQDLVDISGVVTMLTEDALLITTDDGQQIQANMDGNTVMEISIPGQDGLAVGDYVDVVYDGIMTRSLPGQIYAQVVRANAFDGVVSEVQENSFTLTRDDGEPIIVNAPDTLMANVTDGARLRVYFNGAMTMSLPAQIGATYIVKLP